MSLKKVEAFNLIHCVGKEVTVLTKDAGTTKTVFVMAIYEGQKHVLAKFNHSSESLSTTEDPNIEYFIDIPEPPPQPEPLIIAPPEYVSEPIPPMVEKEIDPMDIINGALKETPDGSSGE